MGRFSLLFKALLFLAGEESGNSSNGYEANQKIPFHDTSSLQPNVCVIVNVTTVIESLTGSTRGTVATLANYAFSLYCEDVYFGS